MKRFRSLSTITISACVLLILSSLAMAADTPIKSSVQTIPLGLQSPDNPEWPPTLTLPHDTAIIMCGWDTICYPIQGSDPDAGDSLKLQLLSGPISYTPVKFGQNFTTTICFKPPVSGTYRFIWQITDRQSHVVVDTVTFTITSNQPPTMADQYFRSELCYQTYPVTLQLVAHDPDGDTLTYRLLSGNGVIDPLTGQLTFTPSGGGVYNFTVSVHDHCGTATANIIDTVKLNLPPYLTWRDSVLRVCNLQQLCFQAKAHDPEGGPTTATLVGWSNGVTIISSDTLGNVCFVPNSDSATYMFAYCLGDICPLDSMASLKLRSPVCIQDTVRLTVILNKKPIFVCPGPQKFFSCKPDSFCFNVSATDPQGGPITYAILSGNAKIEGSKVCVAGGGSLQKFDVVISAANSCGQADTCTVPVEIDGGRPPYVTLPADFAVTLCQTQDVCFQAYADDPDLDLKSVVLNYGTFNKSANQICFHADTGGVYHITMLATDSCGLTATGSVNVTVHVSKLPVVHFEKHVDSALCFHGQLCYNVTITGDNLKNVYSNIGTLNQTAGQLCFTPDTSGLYRLIVTAVDNCEKTAADTVTVRVTINHPPVISGLHDTTVYLCSPQYICLPAIVTDPDNNITSVTVNRGKLANGSVCFIPYSAGKYPVIVTATDACNATVADTAVVTVHTDQEIVIGFPKDTSFALCNPDTLCFPVTGVPADAKVKVIGTNVWWDAQKQSVCFFSDCCLQNSITVQVTTACGTIKSGMFTVKVQTNSAPLVILPPDTVINQCNGATVCFPVGISDIDHNIARVDVTGGTYDAYHQTVCVTPDTVGTYVVTVRATDSCGASTARQMKVTVHKNSAPNISFGATDTLFSQCTPQQICLPLNVSDVDGNLKSVAVTNGTYDAVKRAVCFTPTQAGRYCLTATATDSCGAQSVATLCVTVVFGTSVKLECPQAWTVPFILCKPDTLCIPIKIDGFYTKLTTSLGIFENGAICFKADTTGGYAIKIVAQSGCNADSCAFVVPVVVQKPVQVICLAKDTSMFLCSTTDTLKFPVTISGDAPQVTVAPSNAAYANGYVYLTNYAAGTYNIKIVARNQCNVDSCGFAVAIKINQPPQLSFIKDTTIVECGTIGQISLRYKLSDPDNNVTQIRSTLGVIDDTSVTFTPTQPGNYQIIITAIDACGAKAVDTGMVHVLVAPSVSVVCPGAPIAVFVKIPDSVRVKIPVMPTSATVTILPSGRYDTTTGEAVVYVDSLGTRSFRLIATGQCNADTCNFSLQVSQYIPPTVQCTGSIDTLLCFTPNDTICLPVTVLGTNVQVRVLPTGVYQNGHVCFPVSQAGNYPITIIAHNSNSADTCHTSLTVRGGRKPVISPVAPQTVSLCSASQICFHAAVTDPDSDLASVTSDHGIATADSTGARVCFTPDTAGTYRFIITATDHCGLTAVDTAFVTVQLNKPPVVNLGPDRPIFACTGAQISVPVTITDQNLKSFEVHGGEWHNGYIYFTPTTAGIHTIIVIATDSCGATATDTVNLNVTLNSAPTISNFRDTTIYLCVPRNVCLPITINDVDHNIRSVSVNRGQYSNGTVCFVPYSMGTYPVIATVTDSCGLTAVDTAVVNVLTDQQVNVTFPKDTSIFQCTPDTLCFPVYGVPSDATVKVKGTNVWWDPKKQSVCFFSDCCLQNTITVDVTTACGTVKSGVFTVKVQTNSAPLVILPPDTTITECSPAKLCFPVGIRDIDNNLASISVTGATYNSQAQTVCFTPTGAGIYTITVKATDSCGAVGQRSMTVTIHDNAKPIISYTPRDTVFSQCAFSQICLPVSITDPDGNLKTVNVIGGTYDSKNGVVCFTPTDTGHICVSIVATGACGLQDSMQICVHVISGGVAKIQCPSGPFAATKLCSPDSVCVPLTITGHDFTVAPSIGIYKNGNICFKADTTGTYSIKVVASAQCAGDSCTLSVPVQILPSVKITCPGNQNVFLCGRDTVGYKFTISPSVTSVKVVGTAYISGDSVYLPVIVAGSRTVMLIATGQCGADTCSFTFNATFNQAPTITARDTSMTVCSLPQICIPFTAADPNSNIQSIASTVGTVHGNTVCFTPTAYGETDLTITVTDSCGVQASRLVKVMVTQGAKAKVTCPDGDQYASICKPDSVYVIAPITPSNATVTILPSGKYDPVNGRIAIYVTQGGTYAVTVIAAAQCATDTCHFNLRVDMGVPPTVSCPGRVDTTLCLAKPDTMCFPVTVTGTGAQVAVTPSGFYSAGTVCIPVTAAGSFYVKISATGSCGTAACSTLVNIKANQAPVITLPVVPTVQRCPQDTNTICITGITATDPEGSPVTLSLVCGSGTFTTTSPGNGQICFKPTAIQNQQFCIQATDGCQTVVDTLTVPMVQRPDCDVCVKLSFDGGACTVVGVVKTVNIDVTSYDRIGGLDLLFKYDESALAFRTAYITNAAIKGWEYFTYNLNNANCGSSCPPGLVRLVGIADINNGAHHPPDSTLQPNGILAQIDFQVSSNQNLGGQFVPIQWMWYDCADNSLSDPTGNNLYIDNRIYNNEKVLTWDENDNVHYPESSRPFGVGTPDACISSGGKTVPERCVEFFDGGVCIIHPDSIDSRGDINLNGVPYEIADVVVFTNYFIKGLAAFTANVQGQIAATDVNADGQTLTVADLAYLIRVVVGDAPRIPKIAPYAEKMVVDAQRRNGTIDLTTNAVGTIGVAYFVLDVGNNTTLGAPVLSDGAHGMDMIYSVAGGQMKVLVYNIGTNKIEAGLNSIIQIPYSGDGAVTVTRAEAADYDGQPYVVANKAATLPTAYSLSQNYPNPFNPTTRISFSLPQASGWSLKIFNVAGSLVKEFEGNSSPGRYELVWDGRNQSGSQTASGVYFYRLEAGSFARTMKMILLK